MHALTISQTLRRIKELESAIQDSEKELPPGEPTAWCGECGKGWNDDAPSYWTPAPSARCPYEYLHREIKELRFLKARGHFYIHRDSVPKGGDNDE